MICLCLDRATHVASLSIKYSHMLLSDDQGRAVVDTLHRTLLEIMAKPSDAVDEIDVCSDEDIQRMCDWNAPFGSQPVEEQCAYDIIAKRCRETPDATAISAWDGEMTFGELDRQSTLVALRLLETGVGPEEIVPVYSEKSKWAVVAIVGVIKTGAAFLLMAAGTPKNVLHRLCHTVSARVMVSSPDCQPTAQGLVETVVVLDPSADPGCHSPLPRPHCTPSNALYAMFTSGSTKASKCVIMENRACCETTLGTAPALGLNADTRRLQFSSFAFTMSVREVLSMLLLGGCLCIPSEADRVNDIAGFINRHRVNFANFCPSMTSIPSPDSVPSLRTLMVGGEPADPLLIELWASKIRLILGFGATETAGIALMVRAALPGHDPRTLGRACDSRLWVVNMDRNDKLVPVGAVGELVLQGTGLARHYLKNSDDSSSQFPERLEWESRLVGGLGPSPGRLYKTGDFVKHTWDGSLVYVGRKAQVVKANGQLIDVHEIEHCLRTCRESRKLQMSNVAVVPAQSSMDEGSTTKFVAFIGGSCLLRDHLDLIDQHGMLVVPADRCWQAASAITQELRTKLAPDLVPASLIFVKDLPRKPSGKVDRMSLIEMAPNCLTANEQRNSNGPGEQRQPRHHLPAKVDPRDNSYHQARCLDKIKRIVADVLQLEPGAINQNTNIFTAGVDSFSAMDVVAAARREGITMRVANIFDHPVLGDLAAICHKAIQDPKPVRKAAIAPEARESLRLHEDLSAALPSHISKDILTALHTTEFQAWSLRAMNYRYLIIPLPTAVDRHRLLKACQDLVDRHSTLRTTFLATTENNSVEIMQVVLGHMNVEFQYRSANSLDQHCRDDSAGLVTPATNGHPPLQMQLVTLPNATDFLLIRHVHAQLDGLSWAIICKDLSASYNGESLAPTTPFSAHAYAARQSYGPQSSTVWKRLLAGSSMTRLDGQSLNIAGVPQDSRATEQSTRDSPRQITSRKQVARVPCHTDITLATVVKAAWALTLRRILPATASPDLVFGQVVNGRMLGIPHEDHIVGPCLNIIPVRFRMWEGQTKGDLLNQVQQQHRETIGCWNNGFDQIVQNCTSWPADTSFGSFVRCQNFDTHPICRLGSTLSPMDQIKIPNPPSETANVCVIPSASMLDISIAISSTVMNQNEADSVVGILSDTIKDLATMAPES